MKDLKFEIDTDKCDKCGKCIEGCVSCVLKRNDNDYPEINSERANICIGCQQCMAICPTGALSIYGKNPKNSMPFRDYVSSDDMIGLIKNRRSCRHYKKENVDKEVIDKLKEMLPYAPTGCNCHSLYFSIIDNIDTMNKFRDELYKKLKKVLRLIPAFGILKEYKKAIIDGFDVIFCGAPHLIAVSVDKKAPCKANDPIIALSYFELYAQTLGLGTLWCGFSHAIINAFPSIKKKLNIPKTHELAYVMLFGKPNIKYTRSTQPDEYEVYTIK